ncbi:MAG: DUF971 domain-containing protein [Caldilineaceae bacterium]|nr:DUF971 domain-containing protein [Caldilineaceae bacterium]MCY4092051.1 DUF971 domain-containing protein [Caldilineaceae bacterium]MCY4118106.1 DUF971 domain-containing protein [Caldilineaceae bacterium]MDE0072084.1 DUF971 domain-containing protein [Caldilineaceae bacterium]MDE0183075.1 DUF971 domain-containing protein [Caldilineaceae bacterium]
MNLAPTRDACQPTDLTVDRSAGDLTIDWADGHRSQFSLAWMRSVCPCASCREDRRQAEEDPLRLSVGPPPDAGVGSAELVGNYAIRFTWADGHGNGIYGFSSLRASCPCPDCNRGEPHTLFDS